MNTNCYDCCHPVIVDQEACGCCEGIEIVTPLSTYNRPGLSEISYRIGTHAGFLETMTARLTGFYLEKQDAQGDTKKVYPLKGLTTRDVGDPALALLDAWATVADVLTFYQERIANEGYLRTATERRSIVELARLVGYKARPGVAASVFLAYTIDANTKEEIVIPAGSRSQSIPGPDELPQSFETSDDLKARAMWNNLKPRLTQPQTPASIKNDPKPDIKQEIQDPRVYLKGISTSLKANDPLLIDFGGNNPFGTSNPGFFRVKEVKPDAATDRTLITLQLDGNTQTSSEKFAKSAEIIKELTKQPSLQPANSLRLPRTLGEQFGVKKLEFQLEAFNAASSVGNSESSTQVYSAVAEGGYSVAKAFTPVLRDTLATAVANAKVTPENKIKVYALRVTASPFGHNAPKRILQLEKDTGKILKTGEWPIVEMDHEETIHHEEEKIIYLNVSHEKILPDTWVVVDTTGVPLDKETQVIPASPPVLITKIKNVLANISRAEYGITSNTTRIGLANSWIKFGEGIHENSQVLADRDFQVIRRTVIYAQSEELELAEEPIDKSICGAEKEIIELDDFYEGLEAGRWVIVSGEREIGGTSGVRFSELAMLSTATQNVQLRQDTPEGTAGTIPAPTPLGGDKTHTFIKLANKLEYCFKRETVTIYGNVVKATHGETRLEVLGSGDGAKALQTFALKQKPLTHVSAANPSGIASTLKLFVNNIEWHEVDSLAGLEANDRLFISQTDNEDKTSVTFGNGKQGARLPTGIENIRAEYRNGIGQPGNVKAAQISLLLTKPLGVKEVINPLRASGGADKETRDQARQHVPLAVKALDRLVSTQDYEDFSRIYAGIGKAFAVELSDGRLPLIHVTIAGAGDIPIDSNSDLFKNLRQALYDFGDPFQKIQLAVRELLMIVIEAKVAILPDYQWESVVSEVRSVLLDGFSFERRELGQDVLLSEVISVMQSVRGVAYVDVNTFGGIPEKISEGDGSRRLLTPDEISEAVDCISTRWSVEDMEAKCAGQTTDIECDKYNKCKKYGNFDKTAGVRQRLQVNMASLEKGVIRPAQLAFLSHDVPATLILNQIERLP